MGCGASKEAPAGVATTTTMRPPRPPPPTSAAANKQQQQKQQSKSATTSTNKMESAVANGVGPRSSKPSAVAASASARTTTTTAAAATAASKTEQKKADALKAGLMMVQLNDAVPGSIQGDANGRGRFLSYASGASTPNTSSGNLSWSSDKDGGSGDSTIDGVGGDNGRSPGTGGGGGDTTGGVRNPKMLKHSLSGSAIDLENLHREKSCTLTSKVVHIEVPFGKPIEEVYDGVHNGPVLGSGVSGIVRLVNHRATGVQYAVKCLDLGLVGTKEGLEQLREEIFIMCQLDHPNIVRLEEVYESHSEIYLVQELCHGGELFDRLDEQPDYHYTEAQCARLVKQMLSAVRYLHSKGKRLVVGGVKKEVLCRLVLFLQRIF